MQSFLLALSQFPFIVGLHITQAVLGYTKGLSIKLQGKYVDVARAHRDIQQHCTNIHADNYIQYYQRNLTIPLLDHLIVELNNRFDPVSSQHVIELMNLLPSTITSSQHHDFENVLKIYVTTFHLQKAFHQNYTVAA